MPAPVGHSTKFVCSLKFDTLKSGFKECYFYLKIKGILKDPESLSRIWKEFGANSSCSLHGWWLTWSSKITKVDSTLRCLERVFSIIERVQFFWIGIGLSTQKYGMHRTGYLWRLLRTLILFEWLPQSLAIGWSLISVYSSFYWVKWRS